MQAGFEGNKTQLIDREAKKYADSLEFVDIYDLLKCIENIISYDVDNDAYNRDRWRSKLNYVIERAAKEGVK